MADGAETDKNAPIKLHYIDKTAHVFDVDGKVINTNKFCRYFV